jgi:hypothetical protein
MSHTQVEMVCRCRSTTSSLDRLPQGVDVCSAHGTSPSLTCKTSSNIHRVYIANAQHHLLTRASGGRYIMEIVSCRYFLASLMVSATHTAT